MYWLLIETFTLRFVYRLANDPIASSAFDITSNTNYELNENKQERRR